jgi:hypothetical protein
METIATPPLSPAALAERRIVRLTLVLGFLAAIPVALWYSWRAGAGVFIGAVLAWINARWLQQALDALTLLSTAQAGVPKPRISAWLYLKIFGRYVLMGVVIYIMITYFAVSVVSLLSGLLALGAATMAEFLYESVTRTK